MNTLRDIIAKIEVTSADIAEYQRYVPRFLEAARSGKDWSQWDPEVFKKFFEDKDNFLSPFTMYIPSSERQEIKRNWGRFAELFKELALNQEEPRWDIYQQIDDLFREYTSKHWVQGTRRLIVSLQPFLLASLFNDQQLKRVFEQLAQTVTDRLPPYNPDNWYQNSFHFMTLIKSGLDREPFIGMGVYSWKVRDQVSQIAQKGEIMSSGQSSANGSETLVERCAKLLEFKYQIILQGPPGTGKTRLAKYIAAYLLDIKTADEDGLGEVLREHPCYKLVHFHPSYTYDDFVRGIVVDSDGSTNTPTYRATDKVLAEFALKASLGKKKHVLIIDEINRANLSAVLGELIYALEYRGEPVESMYAVDGDHTLKIPKDLYIIGTMNTADRSAGHIDYAIRRRFAFVDVLPTSLDVPGFHEELFMQVRALFFKAEGEERSEFLSEEFRPNEVALGHSYFIADPDDAQDMRLRLEYEVKPILLEYVKDGVLKESALARIRELGK